MSTVKTTNLQHPSAASPNIVLAADGTVAGLRSTQNTQTGVTYTLALTDIGSLSTFDNASPITVTLPEQATVEWPASSSTSLLTLGAGTVTLSWPAGVTVNGLASGNTSLTLATSKGGSLIRTASDAWTFIPFSGGVEAANFTNTATGTYTDDGDDYKYVTFTGSGTLNVTGEGDARVLILGGGAGGKAGIWNGLGGYNVQGNWFISEGDYAVVIGAGGTGNAASATYAAGGATTVGAIFSAAGGGVANSNTDITSAITGTSVIYTRNAQFAVTANRGDGGSQAGNIAGSSGVVIIAVRTN